MAHLNQLILKILPTAPQGRRFVRVISIFSFICFMLKLVPAVILIFCGLLAAAQPYGLQFSSHEMIPEKRTSLDITANTLLHIEKETEISFDLMFQPHKYIYFGYVMRLITTGGQNIDIVYNQRYARFNFINGEQYNGTLAIDTSPASGRLEPFCAADQCQSKRNSL